MDVPVLPFDGLALPGQAPLDVASAAPDDLRVLGGLSHAQEAGLFETSRDHLLNGPGIRLAQAKIIGLCHHHHGR
jgi:hypothetical protein